MAFYFYNVRQSRQKDNIKKFLDEKFLQYNQKTFIEADPISIPHLFSRKEDIEISGFLTATISWGNRKSILANARKLMKLMDDSPFQFTMAAKRKELATLEKFVHRTFNGQDCIFFITSLRQIYLKYGSMEKAFDPGKEMQFGVKSHIDSFRERFLRVRHEKRVEKHISSPASNSSAKRLCMYLRWMVRADRKGVDFGLWKSISPAQLCLPLDIHTGNIGRQLGLLQRKQNDWKAVEEITQCLRTFDAQDPVKYDFALFGAGVNKDLDL